MDDQLVGMLLSGGGVAGLVSSGLTVYVITRLKSLDKHVERLYSRLDAVIEEVAYLKGRQDKGHK